MADARRFDVMPAIDLLDGRVVRLEAGDFDRETTFSNDPAAVADGFVGQGARWLHVVDLDAAKSGSVTNGSALGSIVDVVGDRALVEVAGGLRTEYVVDAAFERGAQRAVIGTAALRDPAFVGRLLDRHGAARIAVAIDVRDGRAVGHGWTNDADAVDVADAVERLAGVGVETFEVTAIERDGLLEGPDLALCERLVGLGQGSIIASGGIATMDHLAAVRAIGCSGAIIGRALYEGRLDVRGAIARFDRP